MKLHRSYLKPGEAQRISDATIVRVRQIRNSLEKRGATTCEKLGGTFLKGHLRSFVAGMVVIASFSLACLMPGCSGITFQSGDALKGIYSAHVEELGKHYSDQGTLQADIQAARNDPNERNRILNDFIFLIDNNYTFWEKNLYNKKAFADFGSSVTATTLSTLSGVVSGGGVQGAKSILSFIAGGVTSTKASFNSDILQSQNLLAIVSKMRAQRSEKRIVLQTGMYVEKSTRPTSTDEYSIDQGLVDLANYYQAGTFVSALQDIVDKAGKDKAASDSQINELKGIKETPIKK